MVDEANKDLGVPTLSNARGIPQLSKQSNNNFAEYEPHEFGNTDKPTTLCGTALHIYMVSAGPALMSLPVGFLKVGFVPGLIITGAALLFYWYAMRMICWSEYELCKLKRQRGMTYAEMLLNGFKEGPSQCRWFAPYACYAIQILYIITWIGCLNIVLMSENLQVLYRNVYHREVDTKTIMLCTFVPLLLLTWVHKLKYLVPLSLIGNAVLALCIVFVLYRVIFDPTPLTMPPVVTSVSAVSAYLGVLFYNVNATGLMLPLKNEMMHPRQFNSNFGVLTVSYLPLTFCYVTFATLCCMRYGSDLRNSVTENLSPENPLSQVMILLYVISLAVQQPLVTYVVFDTIWNSLMTEKKKSMTNLCFWEYTVRTLVYFASFTIAYTVPNVNVYLSVGGTICTAVDTMIFPAMVETLIEIKIKKKSPRKWIIAKNVIIFLLAALLTVFGVMVCVQEIYNTTNASKESSA